MPKPTFFNLNEDKKVKIEMVAIKEFAERGFHGARLNSIVQETGIAKGSFYQYFSDLEDLYTHIIITLNRKKMNVIYEELKKHKTTDVFTQLALIRKAALQFVHSYGENVLKLLNHPIPAFLYASEEIRELREKSEKTLYEPLVKEAITNGDIIDDENLAYAFLSHSGAIIRQYLMHKSNSQNLFEVFNDDKAYNDAAELITNFIKQGLKAK